MRRTLDQAGNIGKHETNAGDLGHAEFRIQCGKRVVGHLGAGRGQGPEERRLAGVRRPDEAHIGDELEVQRDLQLVAFQARLGVVRSAPRRALEVHIPPAARSSPGDDRLGARSVQVREHRPGRAHRDRPNRDLQRDIGPVAARLPSSRPGGTRLGVPARPSLVQRKVVDLVGCLDDYRAAAAAIAAVRATSWHKWFPPKRS